MPVRGEEFGPRHVVVTDAAVRRHGFVHDTVAEQVSLPTGEVSPMILGSDLLRIYQERHRRHAEIGGLHLREGFWLLSPVWCGERLELTGRYAGWFRRGPSACLVMEAEARGEDGRTVARARATESLPVPPPGVPECDPPPGLARRVTALPAVTGTVPPAWAPAIGARVPELVRCLEQAQLSLYSGADSFERNLHTDPVEAAKRGYAGPVAQGMHLCGLVDEACRQFLGVRWWFGGELDVRFVAPVTAGSRLRVGGVVAALDGGAGERTRLGLDVWITCEDRPVLVGVASVLR